MEPEQRTLQPFRRRAGIASAFFSVFALFISFWTRPASANTPVPSEAAIVQSIRALVTRPSPDLRCDADVGRDCAKLREFYSATDFSSVWLVQPDQSTRLEKALDVLRSARSHGLDPRDYDLDALSADIQDMHAIGSSTPVVRQAQVEVRLTLSLLQLLEDVHGGRLDPRVLHPDLELERKPFDAVRLLLDASRREDGLGDLLMEAAPQFLSYGALVKALARYRILAERNFPFLPRPAGPLRPGMPYSGLEALQERLAAEGDLLTPESRVPGIYQGSLVEAVERFQARHGLPDDGVIGPSTWAALDVGLAQRTSEIEWALERLRWFPTIDDSKLIVVNIPEFTLWAIDLNRGRGTTRFRSSVIVGRAAQTRTPLLAAKIRSIDFNPYWNVPLSITRKELAPALRRDPAYLTRQEMEILPAGSSGPVIPLTSTDTIDRLERGELRIRQRPAAYNALGRVKFDMPNVLDIYLHDTPQRRLFAQTRRDFSHGCIRVENPERLAGFLMEGQGGWSEAEIHRAMESGKSVTVKLDHPVPVVLFYSTVVAEPGGRTVFLADLYGYDAALQRALSNRAARIARLLH